MGKMHDVENVYTKLHRKSLNANDDNLFPFLTPSWTELGMKELEQDNEGGRNIQESAGKCRLKWYGHVLRREDEYVGKRVMAMEVPGKRRRGRPKRRRLDSIRNHLSDRELSREDTQEGAKWMLLIRHINPT